MKQNAITLQLDVFEGPLDLLLYLIKKNDLEISRISIAAVTDQYLAYLETLKELDVDLASDFLYMAAELAHLKSKTLLPRADEEQEEDEEAQDLVARLREYQKYKQAAESLKTRHWLNRDVFARGSFVEEEAEDDNKKVKKVSDDDDEQFDVDMFELVKAFSDILNRMPKEEARHHVMAERISITEKIYEILDYLKESESIAFSSLFKDSKTRSDVLSFFLALLEMGKLKLVRFYQSEAFGDIQLQRRADVSEDVLRKSSEVDALESYR
ncbi:MAG: segregation/condensation protein A [Deltaproteobacteria bacterium]|nr:segregation/condensation protein A [Deltaproteobacteria bacterium]